MTSIVDGAVCIQTSSESVPATPSWFGEVVLISSFLRTHNVLSKITERVRFARKRFGRYDVIDFLAVLFGYAISGERTLEEFCERLARNARPETAGHVTIKQIAHPSRLCHLARVGDGLSSS